MARTFHTYSDLILIGGRLACTEWPGAAPAVAVAATLRHDPGAIVLRVTTDAGETLRGHAPGGVG